MSPDWAELFAEECAAAGLRLAPEEVELASHHARELLRWNRRTNLTRITDPQQVVRRHFVESFIAAPLLGDLDGADRRVLDVGAGGGFPGLAARILRPELELTLLEPRAAKAAFLSSIAATYPGPATRVKSCRLDAFHVERALPVLCFRAIDLSVQEIRRVLAPTGRIVGFPGGAESWSLALEAAGFREIERRPLPGGQRHVVAWEHGT